MFDKGTSEHLETKQRELFHHVVGQNPFISERGQQDIQPTVAVSCAGVQKLTKKDCSNPLRHMK